MSDIYFNKKLKAWMADMDLSTTQLAEMMNMDRSTLCRKLLGERTWAVDEIHKLSQVTGIHYHALFDWLLEGGEDHGL